jgi:tetratricopeptide (TPR) repeat protein
MLRTIRKRKIVIFSITSLFIVIALVGLISNECKYREAINYLNNNKYQEAKIALSGTFQYYRDIQNLRTYLEGCVHMENGYYSAAINKLDKLNDYRDSDYLILECYYRQANKLLEEHNYDQARALFLKLGNYKDSLNMVKECDYRFSLSEYNYFININSTPSFDNMKNTLHLLDDLNDYKDARRILYNLKQELYNDGILLFNEAIGSRDASIILALSAKYFKLIPEFKDSICYFDLCINIESINYKYDYSLYTKLLPLWNKPSAQSLILSNVMISYHLLGTWESDGHYFKLREEDDGFYVNSNIGWYNGKYYKIEDQIFYSKVGVDDDWKKQYSFTFINENEMQMYAFKNGKNYTLYRQ